MHYVLDADEGDDGVMIVDRPEIPGHENLAFDDGIAIDGDVPLFDVHMDEDCQGALYDYVCSTLGGLIVSSRFRAVLEGSRVDNVQYYPIRIVNDVTGEIHADYFVANILGRVACLDIGESEVTQRIGIPGKLASIEHMHLDESKIEGLDIFRLAEYSVLVVVSQKLRDACINAGLAGCAFHEAQGYSTF